MALFGVSVLWLHSSLSVCGVGVCILGTKVQPSVCDAVPLSLRLCPPWRLYVHQLCPLFYPPLCLFFSCFRLDSGPWTPNSDFGLAFILPAFCRGLPLPRSLVCRPGPARIQPLRSVDFTGEKRVGGFKGSMATF